MTNTFVKIFAAALMLSACVSTINTYGNVPDPQKLAEIEPGKQSKYDVAALLGSPSTIDSLEEETWFYISSRQEKVTFYEPVEVERNITAITFSKDGKVKNINKYTLADGMPIKMVGKETPTAGHDIGFLEQFIGNIGRFENSNTSQN